MEKFNGKDSSKYAGVVVKIKAGHYKGEMYRVEDWQPLVFDGQSWRDARGNPAAIQYALRGAPDKLPMDDNVYYGKIGGYGHMIHASEIEELK